MSLYGPLWRVLPGPAWAKVAQLAVLALLVAVALFTWVFPAIAPLLPFNNDVVDR